MNNMHNNTELEAKIIGAFVLARPSKGPNDEGVVHMKQLEKKLTHSNTDSTPVTTPFRAHVLEFVLLAIICTIEHVTLFSALCWLVAELWQIPFPLLPSAVSQGHSRGDRLRQP